MARSVVPQRPPAAVPVVALGAGGGAAVGGDVTPDGLPEKFVKYVPAETIAFLVPITAAIGPSDHAALIVVLIVALLGTPAYLWQGAPSAPSPAQPRLYFYLLAEIALVCWVLGTSGPIQSLIGLHQNIGEVVLGIGAFLIPVTDSVLAKLTARRGR